MIPQNSFWYIFCFGRRDIFCLRLSEENYPKVNLVPDVPDISILCRRTEEVPRTSIKSEFLPRKKKTLLCCGRNSISYQSRYHFQIKEQILCFFLCTVGINIFSFVAVLECEILSFHRYFKKCFISNILMTNVFFLCDASAHALTLISFHIYHRRGPYQWWRASIQCESVCLFAFPPFHTLCKLWPWPFSFLLLDNFHWGPSWILPENYHKRAFRWW